MKTKHIVRTTCFFCSLFPVLFLGTVAFGQEGTIDRITITPTNPGTDDKIKVKIYGKKPNDCYNVTASGDMDSCGVRIDLVISRNSSCIPFGGREDWDISATVDPLEPGNYTVFAELRDSEDTLQDSMTTSFFVLNYSDITAVQIVQIRSGMLTNLNVGDILTLMVDALGPEGTTIEYRFYSRFGEPDWYSNAWQLMQDWSGSNSMQYTFAQPGSYYVIGHVRAAGTTEWVSGDPQGGFVVEVKQ